VFEHGMSLTHKGIAAIAALMMVGAVACGGGAEPAGETESAAAEAPAAEPRVFFAAPRNDTDHATELPLGFTFGVENFEISPVPSEVGTPRAALGHYHLGVNAECLPAGEIIPAADPWVHFGDGSDGMEMTLEDGEYRFSVQIGDDEHRTIEGLCDTITVRMESGI
jgi:hypothetical protein